MTYRIDRATAIQAIGEAITEADKCNNLHRIVLQEVYDVFFAAMAKLGIEVVKK